MNIPTPGDLLVLKTTEEPVLVLSIVETKNAPETALLGPLVEVRRPNQGENGIYHTLDQFYAAELESYDEHAERIAAAHRRAQEIVQRDIPTKVSTKPFSN